nr:hypothetical protein [Caballeronia choica]
MCRITVDVATIYQEGVEVRSEGKCCARHVDVIDADTSASNRAELAGILKALGGDLGLRADDAGVELANSADNDSSHAASPPAHERSQGACNGWA